MCLFLCVYVYTCIYAYMYVCMYMGAAKRGDGKSGFILQIILLHSRFYRYDVHDTILLKYIHFGSILVMRWRFFFK